MDRGCADRSARYVAVLGPCTVCWQQSEKADIPINVIVFTVPTASLFITFMIASVFPWYNGIILSPGVFYVLRKV